MLTILGVKFSYETLVFFVLFLGSEYVGTNEKLKQNSIVQLLLTILNTFKPLRTEDDKIQKIKNIFKG